MGFVDTTPNPQLPWFYNLVHAVGKDCPNQSNDVKLVQYMLKRLYDIGITQTGIARVWQRPKGNLTVDGWCGDATRNWILKFQLDVRQSGYSVLADRRVDRARGHSNGSISNTTYTIIWLNYLLMYNDTDDYANIWQKIPVILDGNVPPPSADVINQQQSADVINQPPVPGYVNY
ncbi:MAG: peptidoglycan-binding protein [Acidobacteriota bacterium]|nr:peptidoglycan-binding protein [Acidobacteriota bacterium]